ncbi:MAG: peptidylprolyl isomerase [Ilumatobacteraceae bacterium]
MQHPRLPWSSPSTRTARTGATAALLGLLLGLSACGDAPGTAADTTAPLPDGCSPVEGSPTRIVEFTAAPPMCLRDGKSYRATIETNYGTITVILRPDIAPTTVNSFVNLARSKYFDGTTCHRAIRTFVVQCGDPTATGAGGPGYEFADELDAIEPYRIGSLAMANAGPNTNGSQFFFITGSDGTRLPPRYTLFGQVEDDDLGVLALLDEVANPGDGPPIEPIDILSVRIEER